VSDRVRRFGGALGATIPSARDDARKPRAKPRSRVGQERRFEGERVLVSGEARGHRRGHRRRGRLVRRLRREGHVRVQKTERTGRMLAPRTPKRGTVSSRSSPRTRGTGTLRSFSIRQRRSLPPPRRCLLARGECGTPIRGQSSTSSFPRTLARRSYFRHRGAVEKEVERNRIGARRTQSRADAGRTAHARAARPRRGRAVSLDIPVRAPPIPVCRSGRVFPSAHCY
jgi:hypothetical protein